MIHMDTIDTTMLSGAPINMEGSSEKNRTPEQDAQAAKKFEAFFMGYAFQKAYEAIPKSDLFGERMNGEVYQGLLIQSLSDQVLQSPQGVRLHQQILSPSSLGYGGPAKLPEVTLGESWENTPPNFSLALSPELLTSKYGFRKDPIEKNERFHGGVDFAVSPRTPIRSAGEGVVVFSGSKGGYGNTVIIQHGNEYSTLYAHNDETVVKVGQKVHQGDLIAYSGNTGRSTGPHLHFEVRKGGKTVNPQEHAYFSEKI